MASRGMEKRVRDPEKRLLFKQGLEDAASMLFAMEEEESILQTRRQEKLWITFRRISRT